MLVCICKAVSDRKIREEVRRGARSLMQVRQACNAGTDCGSCTRQIRQIISATAGAGHDRQDGAL